MPAYKLNGIPSAVSGKSNGDDATALINNRLLGLPAAVPQTTFTAAMLLAWRNVAAPVATLIETVGRRVATAEYAGQIAAFNTAGGAGAHNVVVTATDPTQATTVWTISDVDELDAILGGNEGKGLWFGGFDEAKKSLEAAVNAFLSRAASLGKNIILVADQDAGTIKIASFASDSALTTAANTALNTNPADDTTTWVTHELSVITASTPTGPHFGL